MDNSGDIVEVGLHQTDAIEPLMMVASDVRENDVILRNNNVLSDGGSLVLGHYRPTSPAGIFQRVKRGAQSDRQLCL